MLNVVRTPRRKGMVAALFESLGIGRRGFVYSGRLSKFFEYRKYPRIFEQIKNRGTNMILLVRHLFRLELVVPLDDECICQFCSVTKFTDI